MTSARVTRTAFAGKALENPAFAGSIDAAGDIENVTTYSRSLLNGPSVTTTGPSESRQPLDRFALAPPGRHPAHRAQLQAQIEPERQVAPTSRAHIVRTGRPRSALPDAVIVGR